MSGAPDRVRELQVSLRGVSEKTSSELEFFAMKKLYVAIAVLIAAVVIWLLTRPGDASQSDSWLIPQVEKVSRGRLRVEVSTTGVIEPINKVEIKSKASGLIIEMAIEESDYVKKGDLIARLDPRDTKNAYDQSLAELKVAEATVKQRQSDFERKKELYERGLIPQVELDQARLALVEAEAQLVKARVTVDTNDIRLKDTVVRSPIDGVILTKDVEEGQIISSGISSVTGGTLIATVADMRQVFVKADVDEVDIGKIKPGMKAFVVADAYPNEQFVGKVIRIAAQAKVEQNVTSFEVTIQVDNPDRKLKAGMNVSVEILVADKQDALLVPNEAIMTQKELRQELAKIRLALGAEPRKPANRKEMGSKRPKSASPNGRPRRRDRRNPEQAGKKAVAPNLRRGVIVKSGDDYEIRLLKIGISNYDYTEVLEGLEEGQEVVYTFFSRAKASSDQFRQRFTSRMKASSGLRR